MLANHGTPSSRFLSYSSYTLFLYPYSTFYSVMSFLVCILPHYMSLVCCLGAGLMLWLCYALVVTSRSQPCPSQSPASKSRDSRRASKHTHWPGEVLLYAPVNYVFLSVLRVFYGVVLLMSAGGDGGGA